MENAEKIIGPRLPNSTINKKSTDQMHTLIIILFNLIPIFFFDLKVNITSLTIKKERNKGTVILLIPHEFATKSPPLINFPVVNIYKNLKTAENEREKSVRERP